jgi:lipoprotein-releasing system ATP-binding protein
MPLLHAEHITKSYRRTGQADTTVLRDVSLSIDAGEVVALVGPSGAGKSTLLHILASLDAPDTGRVLMQVKDDMVDLASVPAQRLAEIRNTSIGVVFQFHHLLPEFSAIENVMMPLLIAGRSMRDARDAALTWMDAVGLAHRADHQPSELSGGEQQRVAIARALVRTPAVIFADEPTGNLDSENARSVAELFFTLQRDHGMTCVIATHSEELASRAGRVLSMRDGRIVDDKR